MWRMWQFRGATLLGCLFANQKPTSQVKGLGCVAGLTLCPVIVIRNWLSLRPVGPGPFLFHEDGPAWSRCQFVCVQEVFGGGVFFAEGIFLAFFHYWGYGWGLSNQILQRIGNPTAFTCMCGRSFFKGGVKLLRGVFSSQWWNEGGIFCLVLSVCVFCGLAGPVV